MNNKETGKVFIFITACHSVESQTVILLKFIRSLEKLTVRIGGARNTQRSASFVPPARVVKWSSPAAQWIQIDKTESVGMKVRINKRTLQGVVNYYCATGRAAVTRARGDGGHEEGGRAGLGFRGSDEPSPTQWTREHSGFHPPKVSCLQLLSFKHML